MGRQACCEKDGVKKGPWSADEDRKLLAFISLHGHGSCWREVPKRAGLQRCGKSCRLRWMNYLRPDLKRGMLSPHEESLVIRLHACYGNKWSKIASQLPGRTDNEIKNCWNTRIKKKLREMGLDPVTHRPISEFVPSSASDSSDHIPAPAGVLNNDSPSFIQKPGVNIAPQALLGHPPFLHTDSVNAAAYLHNMHMASKLHEAFLGASPRSVMSTHVTSSLSHTSPVSKCNDEHSNLSTDSDSISSNVLSDAHALSTPEELTGEPRPVFTCQANGKEDLQNVLPIHQIPRQHELHIHPHMDNHMLHNHRHVRTCRPEPMCMLKNETHLQNPLHLLQPHKASPRPLHSLVHPSKLQASEMAQPMQCHSPFQTSMGFGSTRNYSVTSPLFLKYEDTIGKPLISSMNSNNDVALKEGKEDDGNMEGEEDSMLAMMNMPSRMSKYVKEGAGLAQALQFEEVENSDLLSVQAGIWSSGMSETIFVNPLEGPPEPQVMSPLAYETDQASGQQNLAPACNPLINVGPWNNVDCLLSSDPMLTKYSFY